MMSVSQKGIAMVTMSVSQKGVAMATLCGWSGERRTAAPSLGAHGWRRK